MHYGQLSRYAGFLLDYHLDELVSITIQKAREIELPLLNSLSHFSEAELFTFSRESFKQFLTDLLNGTAGEKHRASLAQWKADQLPASLSKAGINARDVAFTPYIRRYSLVKLLSRYTSEIEQYAAVMEEIDSFFSHGLAAALETFTEIHREGFLGSILDQSPFSTWIADAHGTMIRCNEASLKLFGVEDMNQGVGRYNILQDNTLQDKPFYPDIQSVFSGGKVIRFDLDYNVRQVDHLDIPTGKPVSLIVTLFPIKDLQGKVINVVVQHEDVTEKKQAEAALAFQHKLTQTITDNATSCLFMIDENGYCTFMNPAGEKMFGYSFEEIRQQPLHYLIHHHRPDGSFYPIEECPIGRALFENPGVRAQEDLFFRKDGTSFPVSCAASPVFENGRPISTVIEVRDVTEEKRFLQQQAVLNQEMSRKNEELKRINIDLDNFIYTASHDLKSPVVNLEGLLGLLNKKLKDRLEGKEKNILELMNESLVKFGQTLQGLLDVTKAQKNLDDQKEPVDIAHLLDAVQDDIQEMIRESGARIEQDLRETVISFAPANLRSILYNLLSNAIKYRSPERPLWVHVRTFRQDDYLVLTVEDNGLGMNPSQLAKMFTMFKRFHAHVEGTGVGLYIIKRVIENNGGKIEVESTEGAGTQFRVYFPLVG